MPGYDPRTPIEFCEVDFFITDNLDFTKRNWTTIIGGRNLDEAFINNFPRICTLAKGNVIGSPGNRIFYKQMNQIQSGQKQMLKVVPESLIQIALIKLARRVGAIIPTLQELSEKIEPESKNESE